MADNNTGSNCRTDCRWLRTDKKTFDLVCQCQQNKPVVPMQCMRCQYFLPRTVNLPMELQQLSVESCLPENLYPENTLVHLRLINQPETYLGVYTGNVPVAITTNQTDGELHIGTLKTPAFYVPALGRLVFKSETSVISDVNNQVITDQDIVEHPLNKLLRDVLK